MVCNPFDFFTTWYNVILYILLIKKVKISVIQTYLMFSLPILIIGETLTWSNGIWKKCNMSKTFAVLISIIGHWVPFLLFLKYNSFNSYTLIFLVLMSLIYICLFRKRIYKIYNFL